jgi:hypothetical protein
LDAKTSLAVLADAEGISRLPMRGQAVIEPMDFYP